MTVVEVAFETPVELVSEDDVRRAVESVLEAEGEERHLSVVVVDDSTIHEVNRTYLRHDEPTDVIAFDLRDEHGGVEGEILVSVTTARREADARGLDPAGELLLYCIHGTLHLLGYDDHEPEERERMHARQRDLLRKLGYETS